MANVSGGTSPCDDMAGVCPAPWAAGGSRVVSDVPQLRPVASDDSARCCPRGSKSSGSSVGSRRRWMRAAIDVSDLPQHPPIASANDSRWCPVGKSSGRGGSEWAGHIGVAGAAEAGDRHSDHSSARRGRVGGGIRVSRAEASRTNYSDARTAISVSEASQHPPTASAEPRSTRRSRQAEGQADPRWLGRHGADVDGRPVEHDGAVGASHDEASVGEQFEVPAAFVDEVVVRGAQREQVVEVGRAALCCTHSMT